MNILYEDSYCTVSNLGIVINKYYFPLATSKTILYDEVSKISLENAAHANHRWGPCSHFLNHWFHYDPKRASKDKFISIKMKGQRVLPALTPEEPDKLFDILRKHFEEIDRRSAFSRASKDGQTAMDHREAEEQQKAMEQIAMEEKKEKVEVKSKQIEVEDLEEGDAADEFNQTTEQLQVKK